MMRTTLLTLACTLVLATAGCGDDGGSDGDTGSDGASGDDGDPTGDDGDPTGDDGDPSGSGTGGGGTSGDSGGTSGDDGSSGDSGGTSGDSGGTSGDSGGTGGLCQRYCDKYIDVCSQWDEYSSEDDCLTQCGGWEEGTEGMSDGNTVHCRLTHLGLAEMGGAMGHCGHAGPTGAGVCV